MAMPSQAALTVTDKGNGTTTVSGPDNWSATYNSIHTPSGTDDLPSGKVDAVIVTSGTLGKDSLSYTNLNNAENIVVGGTGQLYLQTWDKGAISLSGNLVFDSDSLSNKGLVLKEYSGNIDLNGTVTLLSDLYVWMEGKKTDRTITFHQAVSGAGHTLKTSCLKYTTFLEDVTLGGLMTTKEGADGQNADQVNNMTFNGNVSIGTLTVQAGTTLTFNGENKKVSLGSVAGNGSDLTLNVGANVELALGSTLKFGTVVNNGSLVVEDWSNFEFKTTDGEDISTNGLIDATLNFTVFADATLTGKTSVTYKKEGAANVEKDVSETGGVFSYDGKLYVVATDTVVVGGEEGFTQDTNLADKFLVNGGTLRLQSGSYSKFILMLIDGDISLAKDATLTQLTASEGDKSLLSSIGGEGTIEVTGKSDYAATFTPSSDFAGTVYVTSGNFTYNGSSFGKTLKLAEGVNFQVTEASILAADKTLTLEEGTHEIHVNNINNNSFTILGTVNGDGLLQRKGAKPVYIAGRAVVNNFENTTDTLYVQDYASVNYLNMTGGTAYVTGGSISTINLKGSGNLNFTLAEGATSANYTLGTISTVDANSYGCNITIDSGVTVEATKLNNGWGFGTLTVNGNLYLSDALVMTTGGNANTTQNVVTGSGVIKTNKLTLGNAGTYNFSGVTMKIGSGGIAVANDWGPTTNFGAMTIEATADWSSTRSNMKLVATGSDSTVINTAGYNVDLKAGLGGTGNLTKTGEGTLKIGQNNTDFTTGAVSVSGGKLELNKADGNYTISSLTLDGGALDVTGSVTLNALTVDFSKYSTDTLTHTLVTSGGLSLGEGVDLSTLTFSEGDYTGSVARVGESLVLSYVLAGDTKPITTTVKDFELNGTALTLNVEEAVLSEGMVVNVHLLEDTMMKDILAALGEKNYTDGKPMVTITLAGSESGTITANELNEVVFIKGDTGQNYWGEMVDFGGEVGTKLMYNVERIPEPTTATLSLLALMGLAARRRRK